MTYQSQQAQTNEQELKVFSEIEAARVRTNSSEESDSFMFGCLPMVLFCFIATSLFSFGLFT